jgi:predicted nucleic acid-binding protein
VLVSFSKGRDPALSLIRDLLGSRDEIGVCGVIVTGVLAGAPPNERDVWRALFATMQFWVVTFSVAAQAGEFRYGYARQGVTLSTPDALIAAVAVEYGATLITGNVRDFPMPEVDLLVP